MALDSACDTTNEIILSRELTVISGTPLTIQRSKWIGVTKAAADTKVDAYDLPAGTVNAVKMAGTTTYGTIHLEGFTATGTIPDGTFFRIQQSWWSYNYPNYGNYLFHTVGEAVVGESLDTDIHFLPNIDGWTIHESSIITFLGSANVIEVRAERMNDFSDAWALYMSKKV